MTKIGLLSDTHGWLNPKIYEFFKDCDEIWHAGDIGSDDVAIELAAFKKLRAVYGNIDDHTMRLTCPEWQCFEREGAKILLTHIGFYGGRYTREVYAKVCSLRPTIFVCGHSHILRVGYDKRLGVLNINPGAAGTYGWHPVRTLIRFTIDGNNCRDLEVIELAP